MILDKQNELANAQAITVTAASQNQIDLGPSLAAGSSHGTKVPDLVPIIAADFAGPSGATLTVQVRDSATPDMANARVLATSPAFALADLRVGRQVNWNPILPVRARRYLDCNFVVAGGPMTAGAMTMGTAMSRPTNK